jgi:uncharacterized protein
VDRLLAPVVLFVSFYVATFLVLAWSGLGIPYWSPLVAAVVATTAAIAIADRGRWPLGLFVPPRLAVREACLGIAFGVVLIGFCALLIVVTSDAHHMRGRGFPWSELFAIYLPAAVHEELVFRGYAFQKLLRWNRAAALFGVALLFAALHAGNNSVTPLALANVFLGGILLGLAYERYARLWFPIGLHLSWNLMSGPILGHEVSGYTSAQTVFVLIEHGPAWLTGGGFGIEGSVWMTGVELLAIGALRISSARRAFSSAEQQQPS